MIFIIISFIFISIFSIWQFYDQDFSIIFSIIGGIIEGLLLTLVILMFPLSLVLMGASLQYAEDKIISTTKTELHAIALDKNQTIEGHGGFFLGIGSMYVEGKQENTYKYYIKQDEGFILKEVKTSDSIIYEDEEKSPYILEETKKNVCEGGNKFFPLREWSAYCYSTGKTTKRYEFHIPKNSIVQNYNLNVSN